MPAVYVDDVGRNFCEPHRREHCNECRLSFGPLNRLAEERAGLVRPRTRVEELTEQKVMLEEAIRFMMHQEPRTRAGMQANLDMHRTQLKEVEDELKALKAQGMAADMEGALRKERNKAKSQRASQIAFYHAMAQQGRRDLNDAFDGAVAQRAYEQFVAEPPSSQRDQSIDPFKCTFCHKISTQKLPSCARCKKQAYCSKECQRTHWKAHKKECVAVEKLSKDDTKSLPLTWEQLEEFQEAPGRRLEVRFISDESSPLCMVALCKDRDDICKRVAAYTNSRGIPGFGPGKVMAWKNPRFHEFMDGSSGARIEEEDLANITIK